MAKWYSEEPEYSQITVSEFQIRSRIENILKNNSTDLSNSHWHGSNYGVKEDIFEEVAEDIMTELKLWDKDNV